MGIAESTIKHKNEKIKKANIELNIIKDINFISVIIEIDQMIEPQMRPRVGYKSIYDPLKQYKKILRNKILNELKLKNTNIFSNLEEDVYISSNITLISEPPKNFSNIQKLNALNNKIKFNKKPDIDNCVKTIYDSLEKIFFFNDSQIVEEKLNKIYGTHEATYINLKIYKQPSFKGKKLTKKEIEQIEDSKIKEYLLKEK